MEGEKIILKISEKTSKHLFLSNLKKDNTEVSDNLYLTFKFISNRNKIEKEVKFPE